MRSTGRAIKKEVGSNSDVANPTLAPSLANLFKREACLERGRLTPPPTMPDEFSFLYDYLKDLSETDWATFCEATSDPVTKVQFVSLCQKLMSHVKASAMGYLLPALMKMLKEDPQRFLSVQESIQRIEPACSRSKTTVAFIEDEHDVIVVRDGIVTRIISRVRNICCLRTSSQPSLPSKTRFDCTLRQLGITKEQVQTNVEETLQMLSVIGSTTGPESLSADIAKAVMATIDSTLGERKSSASNVSAIELTKSVNELIEDVSLKMSGTVEPHVKVHTTGQVSSSQTEIHSSLASVMGGAVTAVINRMESCLDNKKKNKPAKRWLSTIKEVLICQCVSLNISSKHAKDLTSGQSKTAEELRHKAKKAVSDVLIRKFFNSTPPSGASLYPSEIATYHGKAVGGISDLPVSCHQPIEEAAASVIETFVETMKMAAQTSKDAKSLSNDEAELRTSTDTLLVDNGKRAGQVQIAATKIYTDVKMVLKDFFGHLQTSSAQVRCKSDLVLAQSTPLSSEELTQRATCSDPGGLFSQYQLDSCTKNVLKGVLSAYLPEKGQNSPLPSANSSLGDSILFRLSDMASSSSPLFTEDDFQKYSSTLAEDDVREVRTAPESTRCLRRLSSVEFQMNAFEAVIDILAASILTHISQQSSSVNEMEALPDMPWTEFTSKDLDLVVDEFVTDVLMMSIDTPKPITPTNSVGVDLSGHVNADSCPPASTVYQNLHDKLKKIFAQCTLKCRGVGKQLDDKSATSNSSVSSLSAAQLSVEENVPVRTDLQDFTTEVMMELTMALSEQRAKDNKTPEIPAADGSIAAPFGDNFKSIASDDIVTPLTEVIQKLSSNNIKTRVTKDVSQVLLKTAEKVMGQSCSLVAEPTASDVVVEVVEGIKTLLDSQSSDSMAKTTSDVKGNNVRELINVPETPQQSMEDFNVIWTTCSKILGGLQGKVLDFFTKYQQVGTELKGNAKTHAKNVISAALICIKKDLPKSKGRRKSEDVEMITDILNAMLRNIDEVDVQDDQDLTQVEEIVASSSSSHSNTNRWSQSSTRVLPVSISELTDDGTIIKHTYIDMSDHAQCGLPAGISHETIAKVVKTVNEDLDWEQVSGSSSQCGGLHSVAVRLDKSLSRSSLSDDVSERVYGLFKDGSSRKATRKSASDTMLLNSRKDGVTRKSIASQFVYTYAEETLKHFLLPCFNLPSPYKEKPDCLVPASASASSQILVDLLNLLTEAMVKDVMASLPQSDIGLCQEDQAPQANRRKIRRGILRFLPRIPKVKIFRKKTKSAIDDPSFDNHLNKNMTATNVVSESTVPVPLPQTPPASQQNEKGHQAKNCFPFMRLVTAMKRRK